MPLPILQEPHRNLDGVVYFTGQALAVLFELELVAY